MTGSAVVPADSSAGEVRNQSLYSGSASETLNLYFTLYEDDGFSASEAAKLLSLTDEVGKSLTANDLMPTPDKLVRYLPLAQAFLDFVEWVDPDDHLITARLTLHRDRFFVPLSVESLWVASGDAQVFFSVTVDEFTFYHRADPALLDLGV
ncbi:MAG: hypothetical protein HY719_02440, partial [Planctomycetes bacterium]|nr:hypothetical protein [Planctomycetota bacterium]